MSMSLEEIVLCTKILPIMLALYMLNAFNILLCSGIIDSSLAQFYAYMCKICFKLTVLLEYIYLYH